MAFLLIPRKTLPIQYNIVQVFTCINPMVTELGWLAPDEVKGVEGIQDTSMEQALEQVLLMYGISTQYDGPTSVAISWYIVEGGRGEELSGLTPGDQHVINILQQSKRGDAVKGE